MIRNGECGDWRLPDDEFLRTFRLPAERPGTLARRNPLPREDRVVFAPAEHAYCVDGIRVPISVTGFLHRLSSEFDPNAAAQAMMEGPGWPERQHNFMKADGAIKTADEIVDAWARNGEVQRARGMLLHYHAEMFLNGYTVEGPPQSGVHAALQFLHRRHSEQWVGSVPDGGHIVSLRDALGGSSRSALQGHIRQAYYHRLETITRNQVHQPLPHTQGATGTHGRHQL